MLPVDRRAKMEISDKRQRRDVVAGCRLGSLWLEDTDVLTAVFTKLAVRVRVCDTAGDSVFFSPGAEQLLDIGAMYVHSVEWSAIYGCYLPDGITRFHQRNCRSPSPGARRKHPPSVVLPKKVKHVCVRARFQPCRTSRARKRASAPEVRPERAHVMYRVFAIRGTS